MFEISNDDQILEGATIKVIGVGGGGCNAVNTMIKSGLVGVEYIVANTDSQALAASLAPTKVQLGQELTKGLGAGANPEVGRKAALDEYETLSEVINGSDMVFITAGMGGGTGTGAAPVIAKLARELGALTVGVVTKPFLFEGKKRFRQAETGIQTLEESVDSLITIPNQRLLYIAGESLSLVDTFKKADDVLLNAVRGISDLINNTGQINADFADVKTVMANKGLALMGAGVATGPDRAVKAATEAISSPLLEDISIDGATGIIINITGNSSLTMFETNEAVMLITEAADEDAEIIFGAVVDDTMEDSIKVTVVATGLGDEVSRLRRPATPQRPVQEPVTAAPIRPQQATMSEEVQPQTQKAESASQSTYIGQPTIEEAPISRDQVIYSEREEGNYIPTENINEESPLVRNIQEAASQYEKSKGPSNMQFNDNSSNESSAYTANKRAKSIAEKLGFINFDEDELDRPSYLRNENSNTDHVR